MLQKTIFVVNQLKLIQSDVAMQMGAVAHVEAQVTMEALVRATMRYGLIPKVVPAYRKITIGGAVSIDLNFIRFIEFSAM